MGEINIMIYKIVFQIVSPIITTSDICLDSIFYAVSPAGHNKDIYINRFTSAQSIGVLPIPIDCAKIGGRFIYLCSTFDFGSDAKLITDNATKRRDDKDYLYYHQKQTPRTGVDKDRMLKLYGVSTNAVSALLSTTNRAALERYVKRIKNIGGMRKQGYGEVASYQIIEMPAMEWQSCIVDDKGIALRNIPACFVRNKCTSIKACFPPYWLPDAAELCAAAGEAAELRDDVFLSPFKR